MGRFLGFIIILVGLAIFVMPFLNQSIENSQAYFLAGLGLALLGVIYSMFSRSLAQPYHGPYR